jgi:hypothetical protein
MQFKIELEKDEIENIIGDQENTLLSFHFGGADEQCRRQSAPEESDFEDKMQCRKCYILKRTRRPSSLRRDMRGPMHRENASHL